MNETNDLRLAPSRHRPVDRGALDYGNSMSNTHSGRGRRPEHVVRSEALVAALDILLAEGAAAFTFEKVSARSGVSRVTLNKYWSTRGALALDAYLSQVSGVVDFKGTGNLKRDLVAVLSAWVGFLEDPKMCRAFTQLIGLAQTDEEVGSAFASHYFGPRRIEAIEMIERAQERGEVVLQGSPVTYVDMIWGACYHRLLLPNLRNTLTKEYVVELVDAVIDPIATKVA